MEANTTMSKQEGGNVSRIDDLAMQAQMFSCGAAMNLLQLGRVLTEARPLVAEGEWIGWVQENAHLPVRRAQEYMQCYRRFGLDQRIAQLGPSQIIALLPMSDEERETMMREHDVRKLTVKEIREMRRGSGTEQEEPGRGGAGFDGETGGSGVETARRADEGKTESGKGTAGTGPEENQPLMEELKRAMREEWERSLPAERERIREQVRQEETERIREKMDRESAAAAAAMREERDSMKEALDEARASAEEYRAEIDKMKESAQEAIAEAMRKTADNASLKGEIAEQEEILKEQQEELQRLNEELLNLKSAQARGEAGRTESDEMTLETFGRAVREFMGQVARMPYMAGTFAMIDAKERKGYAELLNTIEGWARGSRQALETYHAEGGAVV